MPRVTSSLVPAFMLLFVTGCDEYSSSTPVKLPAPDYLIHDLALLKSHDQQKPATRPVLKAAKRVFAKLKFRGMRQQDLVDLLGRPLETGAVVSGPVWLYSFRAIKRGFDVRFYFDDDGKRVTQVTYEQ